jgi:4-diphosphocytidyl-2-C-methyl-D-erythritol kinase
MRAAAKLTTSLRVVGTRSDGHHLLEAEMVTLDWGDELQIENAVRTQVTLADGTPVTGDDLILQALALAQVTARVVVHKLIPPGAGLGGGSADAAAVLRWAGWTHVGGAAQVGADVPFCLVGGRAKVSGIGEVVEPLEHEERSYTLLTPPFGCSTPAVYRMWDEMGCPEGLHGNDLEPAALLVEPRLSEYRHALGEATGQTPRLAGSGSTWFVEGAHPAPGRVVARTIPAFDQVG